VGDDLSDEDAFAALSSFARAITIHVKGSSRPTAARYTLNDTKEVEIFLRKLCEL